MCSITHLCPTLCDPMDCIPPGSSVHGIFQVRILEWVAISLSRGSSWPSDWTPVSCISCIHKQICYCWATLEEGSMVKAKDLLACNGVCPISWNQLEAKEEFWARDGNRATGLVCFDEFTLATWWRTNRLERESVIPRSTVGRLLQQSR